jgi:hypothetical protein
MAYYAWSDIRHVSRNEDGSEVRKNVARGTKVVKSDFKGMSETEWEAMIASGAVRDRAVPVPKDYRGAVIDHLRDQLRDAQALSPVDEEEASSELEELESLAR